LGDTSDQNPNSNAIPSGIPAKLPPNNMDTIISMLQPDTEKRELEIPDVCPDSMDNIVHTEPEYKNPPARKFTINKINEVEPVEMLDTYMEEVETVDTAL